MNTWAGDCEHRPWAKAYVAGAEDPFDATDNPGRSIMRSTADFVANEFSDAADALQLLRSEKGAETTVVPRLRRVACLSNTRVPLESIR